MENLSEQLDNAFDLLSSFALSPVSDTEIYQEKRIGELGCAFGKELFSENKKKLNCAYYIEHCLKNKFSSTMYGSGNCIEHKLEITISETLCREDGEIFFCIRIPEVETFQLTEAQKAIFGNISEEITSAAMFWRYNFNEQHYESFNKMLSEEYGIREGQEFENRYDKYRICSFKIDDVSVSCQDKDTDVIEITSEKETWSIHYFIERNLNWFSWGK